ncbi:unnamed protein product [Rotaria sp. Silwood1]|nr:unnamed protein product [Rotaria sp. Silwood1]CAF4722545.1 unnamed protein product [Rotaria sp. Silwood1]
MSNEDDECDSSSLFNVASQTDVNSFLHSQAAKITGITTSISDDENSSMDGSLLTHFSKVSSEKKYIITTNTNIRSTPIKPYLSRSCFASLTSSSPIKNSLQKTYASDDLTELKWLNTFKLKEFKDDFTSNNIKDKDNNNNTKNPLISQQQQQEQEQNNNNNNDEDRLAKLISELKSYDNENTKITTTSFGIIIFLGFYSKRDEKHLSWSLTIKQLYEYVQNNAKYITNKRGWKNLLRQSLITIPCFVKTKRDLLKSRSLWTIDPYYRPLLTKAYLTNPPSQSSIITINKTLSEAPTNRHDDQLDINRSSQSIVSNFAPKATVKTKVLPRLYERLCEEKADDDGEDGDEADSHNIAKRHRSSTSGRKRPHSSSGHRQSIKNNDGKRRSSTSPWATKILKRHKRRHYRQSGGVEPKTSTPARGSNNENRSSSTSTIVTPCPSMDHNYLLQPEKIKYSPKKRTKSTGSIEYNEPSSGDAEEDDERDSSSSIRPIRKSIITTRAQAAARNNHSKNRRKSSPPKKRSSLQLPSHRPNTRINRRIIEQDLKLLRQANVLPQLSPPTYQQPLDLSLGPNRSSSYEEIIEQTTTTTTTTDSETLKEIIQIKTTPMEGVLDLSLSR